jgi:hypothetical protein
VRDFGFESDSLAFVLARADFQSRKFLVEAFHSLVAGRVERWYVLVIRSGNMLDAWAFI